MMQKILGLALGVTVMMMGYVEGMKGLTENNSEKRPGDSLASLKSKLMRKDESIATLDPSKPGTPPVVTALHSLNSSMSGEQEVAQQPVDVDSFYDYCCAVVAVLNNAPYGWKNNPEEFETYTTEAKQALEAWRIQTEQFAKGGGKIDDPEDFALFAKGVSLYLEYWDVLYSSSASAKLDIPVVSYLQTLAGKDIWRDQMKEKGITLEVEQQEISSERRKQLSEALAHLADELDGEDDDF